VAGNDLARLVLFLIAGAALVNLSRGTLTTWLRAKFIGNPAKGG
jgi:hypothetical protein